MADVTIPDLPAAASVASDMVFEVCATPSVTPASKKVTAAQILEYIVGSNIQLNADGSASFANGQVTISAAGDAIFSGTVQMGSGVILQGLIVDESVALSPGAAVQGLFLVTLNSGVEFVFNTNGQNETGYDINGSVAASLTIDLPDTTFTGQLLRYMSADGVTSVTISGTVSAGPGVTTLSANQVVIWQAIDDNGTFIQLQ